MENIGRRPTNEIIVDISMYDYAVDGVPLSWLTVKNTSEARTWYHEHCPYLPSNLAEAFADADFERKVLFELANK